MKLIDADALLERLNEVYQDTSLYHEWRWFLKIYGQEVENAPTIGPVRHGRWVISGETINCSVCNNSGWSVTPFESLVRHFNYCPNCGARMDGGEENEID